MSVPAAALRAVRLQPSRPVQAAAAIGVASLAAFAAAALAAGLGRAVTTSYLPLLLDRIGTSAGVIGSVMLVNAAAGFAVPLVVGIWSDRLRARGHGRTVPFVLGGSLLAAGGLAAVALGSESSFLALALFGAVTYVGLNAVTTAHRALIPENFSPAEHAKATGAQEFAMLVGGLAGVAVGGVLVELAGWLPFALAAVALPLFAFPTVLRMRGREPRAHGEVARDSHSAGYYLKAVSRPGVRALLAAQILWVLGYAALPSFFILYAERVLGLRPSVAAVWLVAFGVATGATMLVAGRVRKLERHKPLLLLGVLFMGGGFLAAAVTSSLLLVGPGLLAAAVGFGLVSTIGFPLYSSLIPQGEAGGYTALYFSVRAISSSIALPAAGWAIAATGSYRALFVLGGAVTLAALVPLSRVTPVERGARPRISLAARLPDRRWSARWAGALAALYALTLGTGLLIASTGLHRLDEAFFRAVNALGPGPRLFFEPLEEPVWNYLLLAAVALGAAALTSRRRLPGVLALAGLSASLSFGLLQAVYALYDRARPSEVFDQSAIVLAYGRNWARIESFPSGHMAVATALAAAAWLAFPRLRLPLVAFVGLHGFTRVLFGAHFPLDVLTGIALGYGSAVASGALLGKMRVLELPRSARQGGRLEGLACSSVAGNVGAEPGLEELGLVARCGEAPLRGSSAATTRGIAPPERARPWPRTQQPACSPVRAPAAWGYRRRGRHDRAPGRSRVPTVAAATGLGPAGVTLPGDSVTEDEGTTDASSDSLRRSALSVGGTPPSPHLVAAPAEPEGETPPVGAREAQELSDGVGDGGTRTPYRPTGR